MKKQLSSLALFAAAWLAGGSALAHDGDHSYTNGICTIEGCTDKYQAPALVDGWYELTNAGNVEWIGDYVENVAINPNVKMMNDIDFTGVSFRMIGRNSGRKFNGVFDGQGHRITNLVLNYGSADTPTAIGFFAWVRGGSTIKNVIMDKTCYFEGKVRVAAFVGVTQVVSAGAVRIENCVNEANVKGHTGATGGFIGCRNPDNQDTPQAIVSGCVNLGDITCTDKNEAAAFVGWANSASDKHIVENCYNLGNITSDGDKRGFIRGDNLQITNSYDFGSNKANNNQKTSFDWTTDDPVASGELAFHLNQVAGAQVLYQTLGTDADDAYPVPFSTSGQVYAHGNYRCDGVALPGTTYNNVASGAPNIPPHNYSANGICQNEGCTAPYQEPATDGDGYMLLANAGNVEWFSNLVATSNGSHVAKVKLTADIDFENVVNLHSPIGPSTGSKFKGEFDGQGHRIMNMIINRPTEEGQGFFGWLQGNSNTTIRNLIIDSSCSITGSNKCGGLAGASQNKSDVAVITIENVVNGANVTVSGQDVAGIVGGESGDKATYYVHNVVNTGTITSTHESPYAGALFCFQEKGTVKNFLNLGTIVGHRGGNLGRFNGTWNNVVDLSNTNMSGTDDGVNRGIIDGLTIADIASGKLAYYINNVADETAFYQIIGTDAYPMPFAKEGAVVYQNGNYSCPNTVESPAYSNTENITGNNTSHTNNTKGFCTYCDEVIPDHISAVDNFLPLSSSDDLVWFSAMVNAGNTTINGKLTSDVDMSGVTYTPIGNNTNRYHGTFDGNGHKVNLNIDANAYGQGFISIATGGTTIRNLVITGTVKNAGSKTAGIIAEAIGGGVVTIQNCGNEAKIQGTSGETAAIIANNWGYQCTLNIENVYNIGDVSGVGDVSSICACQGNDNSVFKNVYNSGTVTGDAGGKFVRTSSGTYTNCYSTTKTAADNASIIETSAAAVESGELCAKLGYGFRQNLNSDAYPNFASGHGFVAQIGNAGYSTMYNKYSDVDIPSGIEAFAGVVNGENLSLVAITDAIAKEEPVVLKGNAGLYNFMPTTGASKASSNSLSGSNGSVTGDGSTIFALSKQDDEVGFYCVDNGIVIPEGKAYLVDGSLVKGFTFVFDDDDPTGINEELRMKNEESSIYNLAGQMVNGKSVNGKLPKGIYIVNGKKVMVK